MFDPLRGLCDDLIQTSAICSRLRGKAYDAGIPLADYSLEYFLRVGLVTIAFVALSLMAIGANKLELKRELERVKKSNPPVILLVYVVAGALISLAALTDVVFDVVPSRKLPPELMRPLASWVGLFFWFHALLLFCANRYAPSEPPEKLEPTPADYWNKRE